MPYLTCPPYSSSAHVIRRRVPHEPGGPPPPKLLVHGGEGARGLGGGGFPGGTGVDDA